MWAVHPLPYLGTLLLTHNIERAEAARRIQEPSVGPANGGTDGGAILGVGRGGGGVTPGQNRIPADRDPNTNPRLI